MARVIVERTIAIAPDRRAAWHIVSDTERLNRAAGLGRLALEPLQGRGAARYLVRTVAGGFPLRYEERPFEWIDCRVFAVRRVMQGGVVASLETRFELADDERGGTRIELRITAEPRLALVAPLVRLSVHRSASRLAAAIRDAADRHAPARAHAAVNAAELHRAAAELARRVPLEERPIAERLAQHVETAADLDVDRIRPFELADGWAVDRRAVLGVALHAVVAGLLELRWDVVCPSCRLSADRTDSLASLPAEGHCQLCDISFELELDRALEVTFRPAPGVRTVDAGPYCTGGPARTPHVVAQAILPSAGTAVLVAPEEPARCRLFVRGGQTASIEIERGAPAEVRMQAGPAAVQPAHVTLAPAGRLLVEQSAGEERHVKLERLDWASLAATAHEVSTLPLFRRLFARDVLRPGVRLKVGRVALLFTDLSGSTALYARAGDAVAFGMVHDHFELLARVFGEHGGTVIKTMGDAVMAAFLDEADAVKAALAAQAEYGRFVEAREDARGTQLRVGLHSGPCYAVTANGILDYFGQTVNVAARLEHQAAGGEIVLAEPLAERAVREGWLQPHQRSAAFDAALKGVDGAVRLVRVTGP